MQSVRQNALLAQYHRHIITDGDDSRRDAIKLAISVGSLFGILCTGKTLLGSIKPQDAIMGAVVIGVLIGKIILESLNTRRNQNANETTPFGNPTFTYQGSDIQRAVLRAVYDTMPTGAEIA